MVNFTTNIKVPLSLEEAALFQDTGYIDKLPFKEELPPSEDSRRISLLKTLEKTGFNFKKAKLCMCAVSTEIEAQDIKEYLLREGFMDQEFQVYLEYSRQWGTI